MSKPPRASLSTLSDRLAPKSASRTSAASPDPAAGPAEFDDPPRQTERAAPSAAPRDFKTMMCRVNRAGWQEMSRLAIDRDRNLEDLIIEACNDLLVREGFSPVIEKRSPSRS